MASYVNNRHLMLFILINRENVSSHSTRLFTWSRVSWRLFTCPVTDWWCPGPWGLVLTGRSMDAAAASQGQSSQVNVWLATIYRFVLISVCWPAHTHSSFIPVCVSSAGKPEHVMLIFHKQNDVFNVERWLVSVTAFSSCLTWDINALQ